MSSKVAIRPWLKTYIRYFGVDGKEQKNRGFFKGSFETYNTRYSRDDGVEQKRSLRRI